MGGLEIHVKLDPGFSAVIISKISGNNRSWKTGLLILQRKRLSCPAPCRRALDRWSLTGPYASTSDHDHVRGNRDVDSRVKTVDSVHIHRKPIPRIEQITRVIADRSQLKALNR